MLYDLLRVDLASSPVRAQVLPEAGPAKVSNDPVGLVALAGVETQHVAERKGEVLLVGTAGGFVDPPDGEHFLLGRDTHVFSQELPEGISVAARVVQVEQGQPVAIETVEERGNHAVAVEALALLRLDLLNDAMVKAPFKAPNSPLGIITTFIEAPIRGFTPDAFPIVELVPAVGFQILTVDRKLNRVGATEEVRLSAAVALAGIAAHEFEGIEAGVLGTPPCAGAQAFLEVARGAPTLYIHGQVHGNAVGPRIVQQTVSESVEDLLHLFGTVVPEEVGRTLDLEV